MPGSWRDTRARGCAAPVAGAGADAGGVEVSVLPSVPDCFRASSPPGELVSGEGCAAWAAAGTLDFGAFLFQSTNATTTPVLFHGYLATTTIAASSAIATADVRSTTGRMYWNYAETTV